jgi:hypothetical protein
MPWRRCGGIPYGAAFERMHALVKDHQIEPWMVKPMSMPSPSRIEIMRSNKGSQSLLRAKLSSEMKKRLMP